MPTRGHGCDVAPRSANVSRLTRLPDSKLTRFGAGMAILLQKWCTFGYTAYGFSAALGACRIAIGSSTVVGRRRQLLPGGDENLEHRHAAVGIIAREHSNCRFSSTVLAPLDRGTIRPAYGSRCTLGDRHLTHDIVRASHRYSVTSRLQSQRTRSRDPQTGLGPLCTNSRAARWVAGMVNANETGPLAQCAAAAVVGVIELWSLRSRVESGWGCASCKTRSM